MNNEQLKNPMDRTRKNSTYANAVKAHMGRYKAQAMGITRNGIWEGNGRPYPHILPEDLKEQNILLPYQGAFWEYVSRLGAGAMPLHRYFNHLNSSQALCFNLFYPFMHDACRQLPIMLNALNLHTRGVCEAAFEKVLRPEEGTHFDFLLRYEDGQVVTFEVKYTEAGFGTAPDDARHRRKHADVYVPLLRGVVREELLYDRAFLLTNYQALRNLVCLGDSSSNVAVFIAPAGNAAAMAQMLAVSDMVVREFRHRVRVVELGDLVGRIQTAVPLTDQRLEDHFGAFRDKYLHIQDEEIADP